LKTQGNGAVPQRSNVCVGARSVKYRQVQFCLERTGQERVIQHEQTQGDSSAP
jgi:hypothetical protein